MVQGNAASCYSDKHFLLHSIIVGGSTGLIAPPPGGIAPKLAPPPGAGMSPASHRRTTPAPNQPPFPAMDNFASGSSVRQPSQPQRATDWGDFEGFASAAS